MRQWDGSTCQDFTMKTLREQEATHLVPVEYHVDSNSALLCPISKLSDSPVYLMDIMPTLFNHLQARNDVPEPACPMKIHGASASKWIASRACLNLASLHPFPSLSF